MKYMQIDLVSLLGDFSVGLGTVLPFIIVMLLGRRFEKFTGVKSYWWFFILGGTGYAGYLTVYWVQRLGIMDLGPSIVYYASLALFLISICDITGMLLVTRLIGSAPLRLLLFYIILGFTVPIAIDIINEDIFGHESVIPHPLTDITLVQGFMAWLLISYSYFLLGRINIFISTKKNIFVPASSFIFIAVGFIFLYSGGGFIFGTLSYEELMLSRGLGTALGAFGGFLALISSIRIAAAVRVQSSPAVEIEKVETGVPALDVALSGGVPYPTSVVILGETGSGKTTVSTRMVIKRLAEGDGVVYLCLDNTPENFREIMRMMGVEPKTYEKSGHLIFIDSYSIRAGAKSSEQYRTTTQLTEINIALSKTIAELKGRIKHLLIESITSILDESGASGMVFMRTVVAKTRVSKMSLIVTCNSTAFPPATAALLQEAVDGTIELKIEETRRGHTRYIRVPRLRSVVPLSTWTELQL